MKVRYPSQAGAFYAGSEVALRSQIEDCFRHEYGPGEIPKVEEEAPKKIVGIIVPHAGYMYSGHVAAHSYLAMGSDGTPETVLILGPNHTGLGSGVSIMSDGVWRTPLGDVAIDSELAVRIWRSSGMVDLDESAHRYEHSIEIQLPFLQYLYGDSVKFIPICFMMHDLETCREVGRTIASEGRGKSIAVVASTDLTHYESQKTAEYKDSKVIEAILELNEEELDDVVVSNHISMCGRGPVIAALVAAKSLGCKTARLLSYRTSGEISGDREAVVGYAALSLEV